MAPRSRAAEDKQILARTTLGRLGAELTLSNPAFGSAQGTGLEAGADNGQKAVVAFTQGAAANARVVAAVVDLPQPPGPPAGSQQPTTPTATPDTTPPDVTSLALSRGRFRTGRLLPAASAVRVGTIISFNISETSTLALSFERALPGRKVGRTCQKPSRRNRGKRPCTRYLRVNQNVVLPVEAGARKIRFQGRLTRRRSLPPGLYRMTLRARDAAGNRSSPDRAKFRLLPRRRNRR